MEHTINIGWNGDAQLMEGLAHLNEQYKGKARIKSVYGSLRKHAWLAARPDFRLPDLDMNDLRDAVRTGIEHDIQFNYTLNAPYVGSKMEFKDRMPEFIALLGELHDIGVRRLIVSNPMVFDAIKRSKYGGYFFLEVSTIAHIDTVMQIEAYYHDYPMIDTVCGNVLKNRDFPFLIAANRVTKKYNITYEVLANEFCSTGYSGGGTHCIYRDSCYGCHSSNVTKSDAASLRGYPMGNCMASRSGNGADWLRAPWIRPQDLKHYKKAGITQFKVTGRTGTTPYVLSMAEAYLSETWNDNLLSLWKQLETIYTEKPESEHKQKFDINAASLDGFLDFWLGGTTCTNLVCSECHYCDSWYNNVKGK